MKISTTKGELENYWENQIYDEKYTRFLEDEIDAISGYANFVLHFFLYFFFLPFFLPKIGTAQEE
jgi:hypothetical protein